MLTEKQQKIYGWLDDKLKLPVYAEAYKGAVNVLKEKYPGYITFVSHTCRDIMNQLARTVSGISASQVQYKQLVDGLENKWRDEWRNQGLSSSDYQEDGHVIPYDICEVVTDLIEKHREGQNRNQKNTDFFFDTFLGSSERDKIPNIKKWKEAKDFFMGNAHLREKSFSGEVQYELKEHFETLEEFLYIAATSEYSRIRSLDEILEEANK